MSKNEATTTKTSRVTVKKKNWYTIQAPAEFGKRELGETYLASPENAVGRTVQVNLRELTSNSRDQNIYLRFKIIENSGRVLNTQLIGYSLTTTSVKRLVRPNTNRLDDYFTFTCKDGNKVVVKTLIITLHKVQRSVSATLREYVKEYLRTEIESNDFPTFMLNLVGNKVLSPMKKNLHKIYPAKEATIRMLYLQGEVSGGSAGKEIAVPNAVAEEPVEEAKVNLKKTPELPEAVEMESEPEAGLPEAV